MAKRFVKIEFNDDEVELAFNRLSGLEKDVVSIMEHCMTIVVSRAKQIITEKRHIITGNLRRSIRPVVHAILNDVIEGRVGSHLHYAYYVENLPDGGYLFEALVEKFDEMVKCMGDRLKRRLD